MRIHRFVLLAISALGACTGSIEGAIGPSGLDRDPPTTPGDGVEVGGGRTPAVGGASSDARGVACSGRGLLAPRLLGLPAGDLRGHIAAALPGLPAAALDGIALQSRHITPAAERGISAAELNGLRQSAHEIAEAYRSTLPGGDACVDAARASACATGTLKPIVARLFRRNPRPDEWAAIEETHRALTTSHGATQAFTGIIAAILLSPQVLFHTERGAEIATAVHPLGNAEALVLARLAFTGRTPDAEEVEAFAGLSPAELRRNLGRLAATWTGTPVFRERALDFAERWIGIDHLDEVDRTGGTFDAPIRAALRTEVRRFIADTLFVDGRGFEALFSRPLDPGVPALGAIYGSSGPATAAPRRGLLALAGVLTAHAGAGASDPVKRGVMVRTGLLCEPLPAPVADADFSQVKTTDAMQTRERFEALAALPACRSCHEVINPPGYLFEEYDQLGRYRSMEKGRPVDASGTIPPFFGRAAYAGVGDWTGIGPLGEWLARSPEARRCFPTRFTEYLLAGDVPGGVDNCAIASLASRFVQTGRLDHLAEDVVQSDLFLQRDRSKEVR